MLILTACGGTPAPGDPGAPPGSDVDPASCREVLSGPIRANLHLVNYGEGCDYRIVGANADNLEVLATVTADPGAVMLVDSGVRIMVSDGGSLNVAGTSGNPVSFIGTLPERGSWDGICFGTNPGAGRFDHVHIAWAGNNALGTSAYQCRGAIGSMNASAQVHITNSIIFGSKSTGIQATRMTLGDFSNNRLSNNAEYGIRVSGENVSRLDRVTDYAGRNPVLSDGSVTPNGIEAIYVWPGGDGVHTTDKIHEWKNHGVPYHIAADSSAGYTQTIFQFNSQTRTVIEAGTVLLMGEGIPLTIADGAIVALAGNAADEVMIRADAMNPAAGHWLGFNIRGGALISNRAEIRHGGRADGSSPYRSSISFNSTQTPFPCSSMANTVVADSELHGIQISGSYSDFVHIHTDSVSFEGNAGEPIQGTAAGPAVTTIEAALECLE